MRNSFDYGLDIDNTMALITSKKEKIETNEVGDRVAHGNEYYEGEKEAIEKWIKAHKKIS